MSEEIKKDTSNTRLKKSVSKSLMLVQGRSWQDDSF